MKNLLNLYIALAFTMTVVGVSGCGGASNTVEMPTSPGTAPKSGPVGVNPEGGDTQPAVTAPATPEP